ncbi:MAG: hypothetical protein JRJ56_03800, partial [Deltaproteobacteria bacterium]|nr:hypothetical protein [Deltaproteobacteria bacterium]
MTDRRYWPLVLMILLFLASSLLPVGAAGAAEKVPPGRCTAVGLDEAAAILGVPARDLVPSIGEVPVSPDDRQRGTYRVPPYICRVRSKANLLKNISYTVYVYRDPALAR